MSLTQKAKLRRHKHNLRKLSLKRTSVKQRKKILQRGGFPGALITPISVLGSLFSGAGYEDGTDSGVLDQNKEKNVLQTRKTVVKEALSPSKEGDVCHQYRYRAYTRR